MMTVPVPAALRAPMRMLAIALSAVTPALPAIAAQADATGAETARGLLLFKEAATPPCAVCHTLADADAFGAIGPSLDEVKPTAARVEAVLRKGLGAMPAYDTLSDADIRALAQYVSHAAGGGR